MLPASVQGAVKFWDGSSSGNWATGLNWSGSLAPAAGDDLVFPSGVTRLLVTNDFSPNRAFNSITFGASNYFVRGSTLLITNGITSTNPAGPNTIDADVDVRGSQFWTASGPLAKLDFNGDINLNANTLTVRAATGDFFFSGIVSGTGNLVKTNVGTLRLDGAGHNTYTGFTRFDGGVLELDKFAIFPSFTNYISIPGDLTIGDGNNIVGTDVLRLLSDDQIADAADVTVKNSGWFDLNDNSDRIASLTMQGGTIDTGSGLLTLGGNVTSLADTHVAFINGSLSLGGTTRTFDVANSSAGPEMHINANIIPGTTLFATAGIIKNGAGVLWLQGTNTYNGITTVNDGQLTIASDKALGATVGILGASEGTILNGNAILFVNGVQVTNEDLTVNSTNSGGALNSSGAAVWTGDILLNTNAFIASSGTFLLLGQITGVGGFTKISTGSLTIGGTNANTYTGTTTVKDGTLFLDKDSAVVLHGAMSGPLVIGEDELPENTDVVRYLHNSQLPDDTDITINASGLLDLNGFGENVRNLVFNGGDVSTGTGSILPIGDITVNRNTNSQAIMSGRMSVLSNPIIDVTGHYFSPDLRIDSQLFGAGGFTKNGVGEIGLTASNTFTGTLTVNDGFVLVDNSFALGTTNGGTIVNAGAVLALRFDSHVPAEALTLAGTGQSSFGALSSSFGSNSWAGNITLSSSATISVDAGDFLNLSGGIGGGFNLTKTGTGTLSFSGGSGTANTYGGTIVTAGTLLLNKTIANVSIPGTLTIGDGSGGTSADVVRHLLDNQIADGVAISIASSGLLDLNDQIDTTGSISGSGRIDFGTGTLRAGSDNGSAAFTGLIFGTGNLFKLGLGTWTLSGNSTYTGPTTVSAGTLLVNGSQPQSAVTVNGTATLMGNGTIGNLFVFGSLAPGSSPGILTCSNFACFSSASDYFVELTGPTAGATYDQLNVRGTNNLGSATLHVTNTFTTPITVGQKFTIINNDAADAITGIFNGLAEGAAISAGGYKFTISYLGVTGAGNDVVLTLTNVPSTTVTSTITSGNGNHFIDPNECNNLSLVISNQAGTVMSNITATLSTTTPGVIITQPYSDYPNLAVNGKGTNTTPFQISTSPGFICGTDIQLELIVNSSAGSFIVNSVLKTGSGLPSASPIRYDVSGPVAIPDPGILNSVAAVAGFTGPLTKVGVSLWLTHPVDGDLNIGLVSPDGVIVDLSSGNGGSGDDYGTACSPDAARTTFDDGAGTSIITIGSAPPYVGTYKPESPLSAVLGGTINGNWTLRINDTVAGGAGSLRCWSLFLYPMACSTGGGACDNCLPAITGSITAGDLSQTNRLTRNLSMASCGSPKANPGDNNGSFHYDLYAFTNTSPAEACVTVVLTSACNVQAGVYLNAFDPLAITNNYLGDSGDSTVDVNPGPQSCSVTVPAGAKFLVSVNEIPAGAGCGNYTLQVSGLPCPPPVLAINSVSNQTVRVHWPTSAGGYKLEATPSLAPTNWAFVTNEPIVVGGRFSVTNTPPPTNRFYRLQKP